MVLTSPFICEARLANRFRALAQMANGVLLC